MQISQNNSRNLLNKDLLMGEEVDKPAQFTMIREVKPRKPTSSTLYAYLPAGVPSANNFRAADKGKKHSN
jgi:hypothetical protein